MSARSPAPPGALRALLDRWQADVETLRRRGAFAQGDALAACCRELEEALAAHDLERLTIPEAVTESGYSASQLRRMFKGQQRVPRGALPRKPHLKAG